MSIYDDKIYEYLTKKDNFKATMELIGNFSTVKERLINDFWEEVSDSLKKKLNTENWKIELDPINKSWSKLKVTKEHWQDIMICFEGKNLADNIYYGIVANSDIFDREKINEIASDYNIPKPSSSSKAWFSWEYINYDFSETNSLLKILPEYRDSVISEFTETLFKLVENSKEFCERVLEFRI